MSYQGGHGSIESQSDQQRRGDVVGQVGDDLGALAAEQRARIEVLRVGVHDLEPARIALGDVVERRQRALVALDRDDALGAQRQQRARQSAGAGADLDDGGVFERTGGARDARGEVEVEQKILAERFARRQGMFADDVAQRRQIVDRAHPGLASPPCARRAAAPRQARRIGAAGAGDVEGGAVIGRGADERQSQRDVDGVLEGDGLDRDQRLIVIHADRAVIGFARGFVEHGVGGQRAARRRCRRAAGCRTAGATTSISSMPSEPSSPACGLRPDMASRGLAMPKRAFRSATAMRAVVTINSVDKLRHRIAQREVDRHRHDGERRRPQHHHRLRRRPAIGGELGEKFGVAGMTESRRGTARSWRSDW